jgi:hypothetical protein
VTKKPFQLLFTLTAAGSAVLFAGACALWVRSHGGRDYAFAWLPWPADVGGRRCLKADVDSGGGQVEVSWKVWTAADRERLRRRGGVAAVDSFHRTFPEVPREYARSSPPTAWNAAGFKWYSGPTHSGVWLPYWSVALVTAATPAAWAAGRARRRRRAQAGHCPVCGYDLRATPDRCPECGAANSGGRRPGREQDDRNAVEGRRRW